MGRYTGVVRFRGVTPANANLANEWGRNLVHDIMQPVLAGKLRVNKGAVRLADGTEIRAQFNGTVPIVTILSPPAVEEEEAADKADLWIPKGFVVYPANDAAPRGWGLPVIQDTSHDRTQYSPQNLAPGLDTSRWTTAGALGQVLLTRVTNAGYADVADLIVPLIFHKTVALHPLPPWASPAEGTTWGAFRVEFVDFTAQSPSANGTQSAAISGNKRVVFEDVNTHRVGIGRDPISLPIRGLYDGGQTAAEIMSAASVLGHFSDRFPYPYQTAEDRLMKEGCRSYPIFGENNSRNHNHGENATANVQSATVIGIDPDGVPIYSVVPGPAISGQAAFDSWLGSPPHLAMIESTAFDKGFAYTTIGFKGAFATQHFNHTTQWVECGNRFWQSSHAEIPPLSFFGFASLNLAWETWPVAMDNSNPAAPATDPLIVLTPLRDSSDKQFWLRYHYANETDASLDFRNLTVPALDGRIFMRGRAIAIVPNDGWVLAAAIQKYDSPDADALNVYRLIALVHHEFDQPGDQQTYGMTSYLRIWWCDITWDGFVEANPQSIIRGIYGSEDEGFPWDVVNSPYSWRGGDLVDVGTSTGSDRDLLKYASQWVFNAEGTKAACLRDFGKYHDYSALFLPSSDGVVSVPNGMAASALELTLTGNAFNPLTNSIRWLGVADGNTPQAFDAGDPFGDWFILTEVLAVGYDANDILSFCMNCRIVNPFSTTESMSNIALGQYIFTGDYTYAPPTPPLDAIKYSRQIAQPWRDTLPFVNYPSVVDVRDQVVVTFGITQRFQFANSTDPASINPDWIACWDGTSSPVGKVTVRREGNILSDLPFSNPDGTVFSLYALCYQISATFTVIWIGAQLPLSQNAMVLPSYATHGDDWIAAYVVQPQPSVLYRITAVSNDCQYFFDVDWSCSPTPASTLTTLLEGDAGSRGGWMGSSFADQSDLAALASIPGSGARFLYARAV